jgi:hypothetical protein
MTLVDVAFCLTATSMFIKKCQSGDTALNASPTLQEKKQQSFAGLTDVIKPTLNVYLHPSVGSSGVSKMSLLIK